MTTPRAAEHEDSHTTAADHGAVHIHIMSPKVLLIVYAVLVLGTIATVAVTLKDLGPMNIWMALGIAVFKAALVILFFMHVLYDKPFNGVILITALMFIMVFVGMTMLDTAEYKQNDQQQGTRQMMSSQDGL